MKQNNTNSRRKFLGYSGAAAAALTMAPFQNVSALINPAEAIAASLPETKVNLIHNDPQGKSDLSIQRMHKYLPLKDKMTILQNHIEVNHFDKRTIPCCMPYDGGFLGNVRTWQPSDFVDQSTPPFMANKVKDRPKITPADWLNNENSSSFSGEYLLSQVFRLQATGDPIAKVECARAVKAIQAISTLAGPDRFGWICKPWGERVQDSSSPDQNVCVSVALYCFLPYANTEQSNWIKKMIPAIAAYWERTDYTIEFGGQMWDVRKNISHMRIYTVINQMAYKITNDVKFKTVADRLEKEYGDLDEHSASLFDTHQTGHPGYYSNWKLTAETSGASLLFISWMVQVQNMLRPERKQQYLAALRRVLHHGMIGYDTTYAGHYYHTEVKRIGDELYWRPRQTAWPTFTHEELVNSEKWAYYRYPHRIYWLDATARLPLAYMIYLNGGGTPMPQVAIAVRDIMRELDFAKLHWMTDPHHDQTIPELEYMLRGLSSESPNYIAAYYLGQQLNFWDK